MKQTVYFNNFKEAFDNMNRKNNFSYNGLVALFDYIELSEEDTDTQIEFDVIALCCEFTEYEDFKAYQEDYKNEDITSIEDLKDYTTIIMIDNTSFIIVDY